MHIRKTFLRIRKRHVVIAAAIVVAGLAVGTRGHRIVSPIPSSSTESSMSGQVSGLVNGPCRSLNGLPDHYCTPGVIQETSPLVVCSRSTGSIRPPVSYTNNLKLQQIRQYGYIDTNPADYEEDHLIPLELGGSPTDPKNLWPESRRIISPTGLGAEDKDQVENRLHKEVCAGQMTLQEAQKEISTNWETAN